MFGRIRSTLLTLLFLSATFAVLTPREMMGQEKQENKRIALVIGNSGYSSLSALSNPRNDAADIAAKLKTLKFEVLLAIDATHAQMEALLEQFKSQVTRAHVALVFYAGHGVTINRESFLLPVDTPDAIEVDDKGELRGDAANRAMISMASVLAPLEASKIGIVFLDACRNNATDIGLGMTVRMVSLGQTRSIPVVRGAGSMEIRASPYSAGVFRAYATQLNNVASDGAGRNSPFTKALLKHIGTKGLSIQELMIRVRKSVMEETQNQQVPCEEAALNEVFAFVPADAPVARSPPVGPSSGGIASGGSSSAPRPEPRKGGSQNLGFGTGF